jgi:hypothetical protein
MSPGVARVVFIVIAFIVVASLVLTLLPFGR